MFQSIVGWFKAWHVTQVPEARADVRPKERPAALATLSEQLRALNRDPYICLADDELKLISVFDDLRYDRADMDMLSGPMRRHVLSKLEPLGFRQMSGGVLGHMTLDIRMHMPKFRALGASPFDATNATPRRLQDYYILTPTQTACFLIDHYSTDTAVEMIEVLVAKHPINLLRIFDYLDKSQAHEAFSEALGYLVHVQRKAIEADPLCYRRALR